MDHMGIPDTLIPTMYSSISMHLAINLKKKSNLINLMNGFGFMCCL